MNATAATAKLSVLVTPATKRRLEAEARARKTTVGDLVRRLLDGEPSAEERVFLEALAEWGKHAKGVLARVDATCDELARERAASGRREAAVRKATLKALTKGDRVALRALLFPEAPTTRQQARP